MTTHLSFLTICLLGLLVIGGSVFGQSVPKGDNNLSPNYRLSSTDLHNPVVPDVASLLTLSCSTRCSAIEARVSLTDVHFGETLIDPSKASLDFTVYSEGFEHNVFASFSPLIPNPEVGPKHKQPARRGLRPFQIRLVAVESAPQEQFIQGVTLKGLEPNVNYFWRLQLRTDEGVQESSIAICAVPVCIHDAK